MHVVISGKCLLKIWLSDPEAFETARRMALVLPLDSQLGHYAAGAVSTRV